MRLSSFSPESVFNAGTAEWLGEGHRGPSPHNKIANHTLYDLMRSFTQEICMAEIERLTITLPHEMAATVKNAVDTGDYASSSEVVRAALRDWKLKRALQFEELATLKADINLGLADVAAGRVADFDVDRIVERGRTLLASRSSSV
jgi:antitoxin ParD1/3/4